jgi:Tfp pilus assembly protein PilV
MSNASRRPGTTLIEVLVALLLLVGGALVAVQASVRAQQLRIHLLARRDARLALHNRVARRQLLPCSALIASASRGRGHEATWTVSAGPRSATVHEVVRLDAGGTPLSADQAVLCAP